MQTERPGERGGPGVAAGRPEPAAREEPSLVPESGWHFLHLFYRVDRQVLTAMGAGERQRGGVELLEILGQEPDERITQRQCFAIPGHKAELGLVMAGPELRAILGVQTAIAASALGPALVPTYSFYSLTEVSEYVPDAEQYARILREREGMDPESAAYRTKVQQYSNRLGAMNRQRMYPEFPDWPCLCFYPMSKMRVTGQNWYTLPFEERNELMAQHGKSGMKFAGRVSQVITASTGLDDWEWGVTLWATNPAHLKEIVYTMRFDEASAKYAEFGPFYFGFIVPPAELLELARL